MGKYFTHYAFDKWVISKIYKEPKKMFWTTRKENEQLNQKWGADLSREFSKRWNSNDILSHQENVSQNFFEISLYTRMVKINKKMKIHAGKDG